MGAKIAYATQGIGGLLHIANDTETTIASSAAETTAANVTIPANNIKGGIIIFASIHHYNSAVGSHNTIFRLKTGAAGAEVTRQQIQLRAPDSEMIGGSMLYYENSLTWSNANSVIITVQNDAADANVRGTVYNLEVIGN